MSRSAASSATVWAAPLLALSLLTGTAATAAPFGPFGPTATISPFQPSIDRNGRVDSIAMDSSPGFADSVVVVSTEEGGIFSSRNRGRTWVHEDGLPSIRAKDVAIIPGTTVVVATSGQDTLIHNSAGIWVNNFGWFKPVSSVPPRSLGCPEPYEAFGIAVNSTSRKVFVATSCGVSVSSDLGATWTHRRLPDGAQASTIAALSASGLVVGTNLGTYYSKDGGTSWTPSAMLRVDWDRVGIGRHSITAMPGSTSDVAAVQSSTGNSYDLAISRDGGNTWRFVATTPETGDGCGGLPFVRVSPIGSASDLETKRTFFVGDRCSVHKTTCTTARSTRVTTCGDWTTYDVPSKRITHGDTRDLAFAPSDGAPLFLATDGGLSVSSDKGETFKPIGPPGATGLDALMITEVFGQQIAGVGRHDLYFATQDNAVWASSDLGATWPKAIGGEGFYFMGPPSVAAEGDATIDVVTCTGCVQQHLGALFNAPPSPFNPRPDRFFTDPDSKAVIDSSTNAMYLAPGLYLQGTLGNLPLTLSATWDNGVSWSPATRLFSQFGGPATPGFAVPGGLGFYLPVTDTSGGSRLLLAVGKVDAAPGGPLRAPTIRYQLGKKLGSIGINPTMFAWYPVFAVDPADTRHVIAADVASSDVRESIDSGNTWKQNYGLTDLAYGGFQDVQLPSGTFPPLSALSFSPQAPSVVLAGTWQGGIFISQDSGQKWTRIPGSEKITRVSSFHWISLNRVLVGSYGRGLWTIDFEPSKGEFSEVADLCSKPGFESVCSGSPLASLGAAPPPGGSYGLGDFTQIALVLEGGIRTLRRTPDGVVHATVAPGSTWEWLTSGPRESSPVPGSLVFSMVDDLPNAPMVPELQALQDQQVQVVGIGLAQGVPVALLTARQALPLREGQVVPVAPILGSESPGFAAEPQLSVFSREPDRHFGPFFSADESLGARVTNVRCDDRCNVSGREKEDEGERASGFVLVLNGQVIAAASSRCNDATREFSFRAPRAVGVYKVELFNKGDRKAKRALATFRFSVVPGDEEECPQAQAP